MPRKYTCVRDRTKAAQPPDGMGWPDPLEPLCRHKRKFSSDSYVLASILISCLIVGTVHT